MDEDFENVLKNKNKQTFVIRKWSYENEDKQSNKNMRGGQSIDIIEEDSRTNKANKSVEKKSSKKSEDDDNILNFPWA